MFTIDVFQYRNGMIFEVMVASDPLTKDTWPARHMKSSELTKGKAIE